MEEEPNSSLNLKPRLQIPKLSKESIIDFLGQLNIIFVKFCENLSDTIAQVQKQKNKADVESRDLLAKFLPEQSANLRLEDLLEEWNKIYLEDSDYELALKSCNETIEKSRKKLREIVMKDQTIFDAPQEVMEQANNWMNMLQEEQKEDGQSLS